MFTVGLDVDTFVSTQFRLKFEIFWLFAGTFINVESIFDINISGIILTEKESAGNNGIADYFKMSLMNILKPQEKILSEHRPPHRIPKTSKELGSYLAGLIEGDGYFGDKRLEIVLHKEDIALAYRIKKWIGYGSIYKIPTKNAVKYCLRKKEGLKKVLSLTNSFWVGSFKWQQIREHNLDLWTGVHLTEPNKTISRNSFWTAGFLDADGCVNVYLSPNSSRIVGKQVQIQVRVKKKEPFLLNCLKECWGGSLSFFQRDLCTTWSLVSATKEKGLVSWFLYIDVFPLQSSNKYTQYVLLRKAFLLIQNKQHLTPKGLEKIQKLNKQISLFYRDLKNNKI